MKMTYDDRKEANANTGRCVRPGCRRRCSGDTLLCHGHRQAANAARARYNKRKRGNRMECLDCSRKVEDGGRCLRCRARLTARRPRKMRGGETVGSKQERIAARTIVDADGRTRFHGQPRRGQQPRAQLDEKDIDDAVSALLRTKAGLAVIRSPAHADLPRLQLKDAIDAVLAIGALGCRLFGDVLIRNGCDPEMMVTERDDGE